MTAEPPRDGPVIPRLFSAASEEVSDRRRELRRLGGATRALIERLVHTPADEAELAAMADEVEALVRRLPERQGRSAYDGFAEVSMAGSDPELGAFFDHSPLIGLANPLSPPLHLTIEADRVTGTAVFGSAYEGPPGHVHGGYIAAAFDELLGAAQTLSGAPGMTGRLIVHYRSPTPLHEELRLEGRFLRRDGRKVFTEGSMWVGDRLTAEAEGLFVSVPAERFMVMRRERDSDGGAPPS
ncbi:MAG: PaaI family thioesterase [Actinobacteria bacterium]|nr:PaaI family thioesterase [Actinomycetota bacterium]